MKYNQEVIHTKVKNNRTRIINIRVNENEFNQIARNAESAGLSISRYVRQRMLFQPVSGTLPPEFHQLRAELSGLCNHVNQIARAVHTKARVPVKAADDAVLYAGHAYAMIIKMQKLIEYGV